MTERIRLRKDPPGSADDILGRDALEFVADLQRLFGPMRTSLLLDRQQRRQAIEEGASPRFLSKTSDIRSREWSVADIPEDLVDRRVEITGPTDRKMIINALNSGASVFMADFEDSNTPTWHNMIDGQVNLRDALDGTISFQQENKQYRLDENTATLMVRPRGWHMDETNLLVDNEPTSASLFDFGLYVFNNHERLAARGTAPYFYLPKLENHLEARLWNDVFNHTEAKLGIPHGSIKATVLIEHLLAAFEMHEILYELRSHSAGLNAGRWDYIFSVIKTLGRGAAYVLPDRSEVTMTVPFMRAYTELLVDTCHQRNAQAIGGMAALIPNRRNAAENKSAIAGVRADKEREASMGFDGTWVAHPDLVAIALAVFDRHLGGRPDQRDSKRRDVTISAEDLLDISGTVGSITEEGLRNNIRISILYLASWLQGQGAVALNNLMEDTATAEICRAQIWQWLHHGARLDDGPEVTESLVLRFIDEELRNLQDDQSKDYIAENMIKARKLLERIITPGDIPEFLTLEALNL